MPYTEDFADQLARLRMMAKGDDKWDLSDNDRAAIQAVLDERPYLVELAESAELMLNNSLSCYEAQTVAAYGRWRQFTQERR